MNTLMSMVGLRLIVVVFGKTVCVRMLNQSKEDQVREIIGMVSTGAHDLGGFCLLEKSCGCWGTYACPKRMSGLGCGLGDSGRESETAEKVTWS